MGGYNILAWREQGARCDSVAARTMLSISSRSVRLSSGRRCHGSRGPLRWCAGRMAMGGLPIFLIAQKGAGDERGTGTGRDTQGRIRPDVGRQAQRWDVSGPHFAGWEIYHLKGSPADPNRLYASQSSGWFGQVIQRSNDGGKTLGAGGQQVRVRRRPRHAPVVRRHAAPVGVRARLASRTVADRPGHGLRRRRGRRLVPLDRRRADLAGAARPARTQLGVLLAARRGRHVPAHDPARSEPSRADLHRHLGGGCVPHRRRRHDVAADQSRASNPSRSPTRRPRSATASTASRCTGRGRTCCSCRSTGT